MGATAGVDRNLAQALGAFLRRRISWGGGLPHARHQHIYRRYNKEVNRGRDQQKRDCRVNKIAQKNWLLLMVKLMAEKSGLPTRAAISGVSRSLVNAPTTVAKAAPTTTPTAISTTFPRRMNCLNPLSIGSSKWRTKGSTGRDKGQCRIGESHVSERPPRTGAAGRVDTRPTRRRFAELVHLPARTRVSAPLGSLLP